jgi:hypothetical protein
VRVDADEDRDAGPPPPECELELAPIDVSPRGTVHLVYLAPSDALPEETARRVEIFARAFAAIQSWYGEAMGAEYDHRTFRYEPPIVFSSRYTRAEWASFGTDGFPPSREEGCGMWYASWAELVDGGLLETAGMPPPSDPDHTYVAVGGGGWGGGCGASGLAAVEEGELDRIDARCPSGRDVPSCTRMCSDPSGLASSDPWCAEWPHFEEGYSCTCVGAFAHEVGHGFGLPHGTERPGGGSGPTLMDMWWEYDRGVTLSAEDRADLAASAFFAPPN